MLLYHGSNTEIIEIDLSKCRPYKDFGKGFYLTAMPEQAMRMAERVAGIYGGTACVSCFEFDILSAESSELNIKRFDKPSEEWAAFVINNRNRYFSDICSPSCNIDCKYDIVTGPVADDDLALLFKQFSQGFINSEALVREMTYKKLTNQFSFHTERSIPFLKKAGIIHE